MFLNKIFKLTYNIPNVLESFSEPWNTFHTWILWAMLQWDAGNKVQGLKQSLNHDDYFSVFSFFLFSAVLMYAGFHLKSHGRKELWGKLGSQRPRVVCDVRTGRSLALGQPARGSPAVLLPCITGTCFSVFWLPTTCSSGQVWGARQSRCPWRRNSKARTGRNEWVGNPQVGACEARGRSRTYQSLFREDRWPEEKLRNRKMRW